MVPAVHARRRRPDNPFVSAMEKEHRRVVEDLRRIELADRAATDGDREIVRRADRNLRQHFEMEERILFPVLLAVTQNRAADAVALLVSEHDEARRLLDALRRQLDSGRVDPTTLKEILRVVAGHRHREESLLYPLCTDLCGEPLDRLKVALEAHREP